MTAFELTASAAQPSLSDATQRAKLAVLSWLAQHNIPFEVGGRHLIRLFDLIPVNALLAPFALDDALLSRSVIADMALQIEENAAIHSFAVA